MIVTLVLLGQVLELRARSHTGAAIRALLGLAPTTARRRARPTAASEDVPLDQVHVGDRLRVRPGEKVPVDGVVARRHERRRRVDGHRRADPGRETPGDRSSAARSTAPASFVMRAERVGADTLLAQIVAHGRARRSAAARRSRSWPTCVAATSCRPWSSSRSSTFVVWARSGPEPRHGARARQRGRGADHRVPVRAGARDADVDHGRDAARAPRRACCSGTPRRSRSCARSTRSSSTRPAR